MTKFDTHGDYSPRQVALAERALLTVWAGLGSWHEDLVLVGGLVPKYLCRIPTATDVLPRPVTLDADLGIALGASIGQYGSIMDDLQAQGFHLNRSAGARFEQVFDDFTIYVDFLTEQAPATQGTVIVDSVPASILPGIDRALACHRVVPVSGTDLHEAEQHLRIRVCEVGPFLTLKLRAFYRRQQPKDAFDILYTLLHYDGGTARAVAAFGDEVRLGNLACADALLCLNEHFATESSPAPAKAAHFALGPAAPGESADMRFRRRRIQHDMVDAGRALSGG